MDEKRLQKQFDFIREIDKEKQIIRQTYISDASRKEDDAEHAWHLAMMAMLLGEYSNEELSCEKTICMCLVHDLVEVYAGDTYAYDEVGNASKREREVAAADKLFGMLPEDQAAYMRGLWDEFEEAKTPEARFAHTLDKIQPLMLNHETKGLAWKEHGIRASQVYKRNEHTADGSEALWKYSDEHFIKPNIGGALADDRDL